MIHSHLIYPPSVRSVRGCGRFLDPTPFFPSLWIPHPVVEREREREREREKQILVRDEGDIEGSVRGRQTHRRRHPHRRRRRPPGQGLRHRRHLRPRPLPRRTLLLPREARLLHPRLQRPQEGCEIPIHEHRPGDGEAGELNLHAHVGGQPDCRGLLGGVRSSEQGSGELCARDGELQGQICLCPWGGAADGDGAKLRHFEERMGLCGVEEVRWRGCRQGDLPDLQQSARVGVEQGV